MRVRHVPLFEFMPYGAPELLESSPVHLARAVFTGALGWSLVFALLVASGLLRVAPVPKLLPSIDITLVPPLLPPPPEQLPATASRPAKSDGRPTPVPVHAEPPVVESELMLDGGTAETGTVGPVIEGTPPPPGATGVIPTEPPPYQQYEVDQLPVVQHGPRPVYSSFAREAQAEGLVAVRALVGRDGRVEQVEIERSIPLLDPLALEAVREWTFLPARVAGRPVSVWIVIPFRFTLH